MKFKVGDKVCIKSTDWYNSQQIDGDVRFSNGYTLCRDMAAHCGKTATITSVGVLCYRIDLDGGRYVWAECMFDCKEESAEETEPQLNLVEILKYCPKGTKLYSTVYGDVRFNGIDINDEHLPIKFIATSTDGHEEECDVTNEGFCFLSYQAECTLFPSKEQRDWSKFVVPRADLPIDTPCMVFDEEWDWVVGYYAGNSRIFKACCKSVHGNDAYRRRYIIPKDKFNFEDLDANFNSKWNYGAKND